MGTLGCAVGATCATPTTSDAEAPRDSDRLPNRPGQSALAFGGGGPHARGEGFGHCPDRVDNDGAGTNATTRWEARELVK
jgi:hypothetical protein